MCEVTGTVAIVAKSIINSECVSIVVEWGPAERMASLLYGKIYPK